MTNNSNPTAKQFIERLKIYQSPAEREKTLRYFKTPINGEPDEFIGVRMGQVFTLVKEFIAMTPDERLETSTGFKLPTLPPVPSWPLPFEPQHLTPPIAINAHE